MECNIIDWNYAIAMGALIFITLMAIIFAVLEVKNG